MRRGIALLLLLVFCSFVSAPLLAASSDPYSNLPACCRRGGKHHCMMRMMMEGDMLGRRVTTPPEKCPFFPHPTLMAAALTHLHAPPAAGVFYAALQSHPACQIQAETQQRVSFDRTRQKRGPPATTLLG